MWFIGMIAGALLGAAGGFSAALIGAGLGAIAGALYRQRSGPAVDDRRLGTIEDAIRRLSARVKALEGGRPQGVAQPDGGAVAAAVPAPASAMAVAEDRIADPATAVAGATPVAKRDEPPVPAVPPFQLSAEPSPDAGPVVGPAERRQSGGQGRRGDPVFRCGFSAQVCV